MKRAIVVCDGQLPSKLFIDQFRKSFSYMIACDGAANYLVQNDIPFDTVIGDLDSFKAEFDNGTFQIIKDLDQETNDLEKALNFVESKNYDLIVVIGALGKRIDHTLKNLSVLLQFKNVFKSINFVDEQSITFFSDKKITIETEVGTGISLVPFNGRVNNIRTTGLKYPLNHEWLENGKRDGTSNELLKEYCSIEYESGELLITLLINPLNEKYTLIHD